MVSASPHLYLKSVPATRSFRTAQRALRQSTVAEARGLPAVVTLGHLAHLTGLPYGSLRRAVERRGFHYKPCHMPGQADRGPRKLLVPLPELMAAQRWLLHKVLDRLPVHPSSFAYVKGCSVAQCARRHLGAHWLIKIDIKDFFGSIGERRIHQVFRAVGYQPLISYELSRLCTWEDRRDTVDSVRADRYPKITAYQGGWGGFLPQCAPTSGVLANLAVRPMDDRLTHIAARHGLVYTRYSDDMVFSGGTAPFSRSAAVALLRELSHTVQGYGFTVNARKTRIVPPGARRVVLGLLVDGDVLRLTPDFKSRVLGHLYGIEKFGLRAHQQHRDFASLAGMVNHIDGLIAYALGAEAEWARPVRERWRAALSAQGWVLD
ncbi:reverse transcriptase family protein [Streptomyces sp. NBC_01794]|uniref:reverse transcriptase family protein n=1 Tax=Streptomyces sp. NBC_01794 TaxID=2975942 RepID=UPI00308CA7B7|nr:reverse transcriptase family protein [Streptomyces sp. NBC_01794]